MDEFVCHKCGRSLASNFSLKRHLTKCKSEKQITPFQKIQNNINLLQKQVNQQKKIIELLQKCPEIIEKQQKQLDEQRKEIEELKNRPINQNIIGNTNCNNTTNITNNITINNYDTPYLDRKMILTEKLNELIDTNDPVKMAIPVAIAIYLNKRYPENHSIRKLTNKWEVYEDKEWKFIDLKEVSEVIQNSVDDMYTEHEVYDHLIGCIPMEEHLTKRFNNQLCETFKKGVKS